MDILKNWALTMLSLTLLSACSSGSDEEIDPTEQDDALSTPKYLSRLWTPLTPDTAEGWACTTEQGLNRGYMMLAGAEIPGIPNNKLYGFELNPDASIDADHFRFLWQVNSATSVLLDDPTSGVQVEWSNIQFANKDFFSAYSSALGGFQCSRETTTRGDA